MEYNDRDGEQGYELSVDHTRRGEYDEETLEEIRQAKIRRQRADQLARDRLHAEMIMIGAAIVIVILIVLLIIRAGNKKQRQQEFLNITAAQVSQQGENEDDDISATPGKTVPEYQGDAAGENGESPYKGQAEGHSMVTQNGVTYVDGIMIVNKTFSLPSDYDPGLDEAAERAFNDMAAAAWGDDIAIWICSGYRNYREQEELFDGYAAQRGLAAADEVSARPGHSEHQSGLCMDVNSTDFDFSGTAEAQWLDSHCVEYGFIIRFPQGKESITGYAYEPWHIRYVGVEAAQAMKASGQCLEEYLGVTSDYNDSLENDSFIQKYSGIGEDGAGSGVTSGEGGALESSGPEAAGESAGGGYAGEDGYNYGYGYDYDYGYGYDDGGYYYDDGNYDYGYQYDTYDDGYYDYGWGGETYY